MILRVTRLALAAKALIWATKAMIENYMPSDASISQASHRTLKVILSLYLLIWIMHMNIWVESDVAG